MKKLFKYLNRIKLKRRDPNCLVIDCVVLKGRLYLVRVRLNGSNFVNHRPFEKDELFTASYHWNRLHRESYSHWS